MVLLKAGGSGQAKVLVQGKIENIPMPTLPLTPAVTVQLKNDAGGAGRGVARWAMMG